MAKPIPVPPIPDGRPDDFGTGDGSHGGDGRVRRGGK
jgi:hypothetical protein